MKRKTHSGTQEKLPVMVHLLGPFLYGLLSLVLLWYSILRKKKVGAVQEQRLADNFASYAACFAWGRFNQFHQEKP